MRYWIMLSLFALYLQPLGVTVSADAPGAAPVSHGSREATLSGALQRGRDAVSRGDHAAAVTEYRRAAKLATDMDAHGRADIAIASGQQPRREAPGPVAA